MATRSLSNLAETQAAPFLYATPSEQYLLQVREGQDPGAAADLASTLQASVADLLGRAVSDNGMDANVAFLCKFALDAAAALRFAAGQNP